MIDIHEDILSLFAEAQQSFVPRAPIDVIGRLATGSTIPRRKTTRVMHCGACGRRGHLTRACTNYEDWYEPPNWSEGAA